MSIKAVLFDFDGTIADTQAAFVKIVNKLAQEFGYDPVSQAELDKLKELSSADIVKKAQISPFKIPFILRRIKKELGEQITILEPYVEIETVLKSLKEQGYILGIVTSNLKDNVIQFLQTHNLVQYFDFVQAGTTLFGKNRMINRVLRDYKLQAHEVVYVGDETRDISAAKKSHLKMISVGWGFSSPSILKEYHPDFLVYHPVELVKTIQSLNGSPAAELSALESS